MSSISRAAGSETDREEAALIVPFGTGTALELGSVARKFGRRWVLRGVDLELAVGEVVALLGRNGSGKTTLLRVAATALRPNRGTVRIFGADALAESRLVRGWIGVLGHQAGTYDELTAAENLSFSLRMAGQSADRAAIAGALERAGLAREAGELVRGFSAGMRRRLALARLLLRPPRLLLLDEPYASLDDDGVASINAFAASLAERGGGVLVATHDLARGRGIFDRAVRIDAGRIAVQALPVATAPESWAPEMAQ